MKTFIERLSLENYKSIAKCDVALRPLTVVIGRNGSGKSNFVDSLHFVADALTSSLEFSNRKRGGFKSVIRRGAAQMGIALSFQLEDGRFGDYMLKLDGGLVLQEELGLTLSNGIEYAHFEWAGERITATIAGDKISPPTVLPDRLALVALSGYEAFREAFDALASMRFYRLNPEAMRALQDADEGEILREDGSNISSVWRRLEKTNQPTLKRLMEYLAVIVPGINRIRHTTMGPKETLRFYQTAPKKKRLTFPVSSMSDGTLRALGALVASRPLNGSQRASKIVVIEEPETALHPGAVAVLMDALHEASARTQILVTSHSPDVLDHVDLESDALLVTEVRDGVTVVGGVDAASREAIRRHLYTPGELLRMDQLQLENAASE